MIQKALFLLICVVAIGNDTKADTIDFWHIFYNNKVIRKFNGYQDQSIILKIDSINRRDTITIRYGTDTPNKNISTFIEIRDSNHKLLYTYYGVGDWGPINFPVSDLTDYYKRTSTTTFYVYYNDNKYKESHWREVAIFQLQ